MTPALTRRQFLQCSSLASLGAACGPTLSASARADVLALLRRQLVTEHPRLHLRTAGWAALKQSIRSNPLLAHWFEQMSVYAETVLQRPCAQYRLRGPRLLYESRAALDTISTLAGMYRLDGDKRKANRAREELRAICAFPSWHPPHFLDVAEMTNAAGLGYDWLHEVLPEAERRAIRGAILTLGIQPGLDQYRSDVKWSQPFANNWGQVCAGGLTVGALAIAGDDSAQCSTMEEILTWTTVKVRNAMLNYAPDGGWPEGPVYWDYATHYTCFMLSAMESATGTDLGISAQPGLDATGSFRMDSLGPSKKFFNYADADERGGSAPSMMWLARRFRRSEYAVNERRLLTRYSPRIFDLIWADPAQLDTATQQPALDRLYSRIQVAFLRSSWTDPDAFYIGIKGGDNGASHSHLDLGSFVLDALGERWALDLGPDDYDLPGYFGPERYTYYRLRSEGHNTVTLNGENQPLLARATMHDFVSSSSSARVSIDMAEAFGGALPGAKRTAILERQPKTRFILEDRITAQSPRLVRWAMHTDAEVALQGASVLLQRNGKRMRLIAEGISEALFQMSPRDTPPPHGLPEGVNRIVLAYRVPPGTSTLRVTMEEMV